MTDMAICRGLHRAIRGLRDRQMKETSESRDTELSDEESCEEIIEIALLSPQYCTLYIHYGV